MDTSPEYVKQCEKAVEIQGEWKPSWGDWAWYKIEDENNFPHLELIDIQQFSSSVVVEVIRRESIWLPRQDQLQEMVCFRKSPVGKLTSFYGWIEANYLYVVNKQFASMEQLWLAFVMYERFNNQLTWERWEAK